jgi:hypothetical protein
MVVPICCPSYSGGGRRKIEARLSGKSIRKTNQKKTERKMTRAEA